MSKYTDPTYPHPDPLATGRTLEEESEKLLSEGLVYPYSNVELGRVMAHVIERYNATHPQQAQLRMPISIATSSAYVLLQAAGYRMRLTFEEKNQDNLELHPTLEGTNKLLWSNLTKRLGVGNAALSRAGVFIYYHTKNEATHHFIPFRDSLRKADRLPDALRTAMRYALKITPLSKK